MAGAGADPALSGAAPVPPSAAASVPPLSVTWEGSSAPAPSPPHPEALPLEPWRAAEVLRRRFPAPPPQAGTAPRELPERSAPPPQHPCPVGGDRDMQGHRGAADSAAPGCAPPPAPAGQRAQACWQRCHTGPLAGLLWLLVCGPHCAWGWQLMLGAGQGWCRLLPGAPRGLREWAGSECVLCGEMLALHLGRPGCMQSPGSPGWGRAPLSLAI